MKKLLLSLLALTIASPAIAQVKAPIYQDRNGSYQGAQGTICINPDGTACPAGTVADPVYTSQSSSALPTGAATAAKQDTMIANQTATGTSAQNVQGAQANGTTYVVNPLAFGCYGSSTAPTAVTAGQVARSWCGLNGQGAAMLSGLTGAIAAVTTSGISDGAAQANGLQVWAQQQCWNGATWDRCPGNTNGMFMVTKGGSNLATSQVSVTTSATLLAAARAGRQKVTVAVGAANACAFGNTGVTTTTGFALQAVAGATLTLDTNAALYGVCSSTTTISVIEQF